ncbi:hypothetical protein FS837_003128 [Tulasnella sp. UAMH 9824]|nr:hypothetical protein FS837_003128 [Tulasnella sp. UAMH 9824]
MRSSNFGLGNAVPTCLPGSQPLQNQQAQVKVKFPPARVWPRVSSTGGAPDEGDKPDWWKDTPQETREEATSWITNAERSYRMRSSDLPWHLDVTLSPLLILQISCNTQDNLSPTVADEVWQKLKHLYSSRHLDLVCYVEIQVNGLFVHADPVREQAKHAARDFLGVHRNASVIMVLDAHAYTGDGTVVFYDRESAPLAIVLAHTLGRTLWTAISEASGPLKVLVPMVCGWLWALAESVEQAKDVMRQWLYWQPLPKKWANMPALCDHVISFSSTTPPPWTLAFALASTLEDVILTQVPLVQAVELRICRNHELTRGIGVILGALVESGEPEYHLYKRSYGTTNLFGLQFPSVCDQCHSQTTCIRNQSPEFDPCYERRIVCNSCKWGTRWLAPPDNAIVAADPDLFRWKLPLAKQLWEWVDEKDQGHADAGGRTKLLYC